MERINQFEFFLVGKAFASMAARGRDVDPSELLFALFDLRDAIARLSNPQFFPLHLCRPELEKLSQGVEEIFARHFSVKAEDGSDQFRWPTGGDPPIPAWRLTQLQNVSETFERVFGAELREAATYYVPRRGIFDTPSLVDAADQAFPKELQSFIPEKARDEWRQAGRCFAFSLLSASGFHVARAAEGTMEAYHKLFCPAGKSGLKLWKDYIEDFESCMAGQVQSSPSKRVIAEIQQMKDDYRNPLMHPRVVLTEADARMLYANGESLIILMAQEMQAAIRSGAITAVQDVA